MNGPDDSVAGLARALRSGELTSVQLATGYLARIRALDERLHAYCAVYADQALEAAGAADRLLRAGCDLGPLHGVPVAVKDLADIAGQPTTGGSPILAGRRARHSAALVRRLQAAGAIVLGKTHMVQFALGAWGVNQHMGTPRNPWDPAQHRVPGGSSSGSAVAVAAGLAPLAIGTDTGGSVRVPASFCGITGFKPAAGHVDDTGTLPLARTLDSIGVFARSAEDAALLYAALRHDAGGPAGAPAGDAAGLRLGRLDETGLRDVQPAVRAAYEAALDLFQAHGARIETVALPATFDEIAAVSSTIMLAEAAAEYGDLAADQTQPMDDSVRPRLLAGIRIAATRYVQALRQRERWQADYAAATARLDAVLTPTTPATAIPLAEVDHDKPPVRYTRLLNLLNLCGASVPSGFDPQGLPTAIQIAGATQAGDQVLAIARLYQQLTDWHRRRPPLS